MANEGALVNGLMLVAASALFFMSVYASGHRWRGVLSSTTIGLATLFWTLSGLMTLFMGVRQLFAYFGAYVIDRTFITVLLTAFTFTSFVLAVTQWVVGPVVTYWGTQYDIVSDIANGVILFGIFIPGVIATTILFLFSKFAGSPRTEASLFYTALSMFILTTSISLDTIIGGSLGGVPILAFRALILVSALLAFLACAHEPSRRLKEYASQT